MFSPKQATKTLITTINCVYCKLMASGSFVCLSSSVNGNGPQESHYRQSFI